MNKSEEITAYNKWLTIELNKRIKKIELAHCGQGITKDFVYVQDILKIINGASYDDYQPPAHEHDVIAKYFDNIDIDFDKKDNLRVIKCWNIHDYKTYTAYNFYEILIFPTDKRLLILGHIDGKPYEYKYYYRDLYHLEHIIKETFIQNCLYAKYDKQPVLKLKGDKNNETS